MPNRKKILIVDDELSIALTLCTILKRAGYETAEAHSGEEAIGCAASFKPDCLLTDVIMGAKNGIDAAIEILNSQPQCKVLFISGHAACHDLLLSARERGFDFEIMNKPVSPSELLERIRQVLS